MERLIRHDNQTQIFIETPYRNNKLMNEMCKVLPGNLALCVATDITGEKEKIETKTIKEWAKTKYDFDKVPTIFLLYK